MDRHQLAYGLVLLLVVLMPSLAAAQGTVQLPDRVGPSISLNGNLKISIPLTGQQGAEFFADAGTLNATLTVEARTDPACGTGTGVPGFFVNLTTGATSASVVVTNPSPVLAYGLGWVGSASCALVSVAWTSGAANGRVIATTNRTYSVPVVAPGGPALPMNLTQVGSNNVVTGIGTSGVGIPRVTVSSDSSITANAGTNLNTSALALDATVTNRLPAGSTPADNESNAITATRLGAYNYVFDGATWDRWTGAVTANAGTNLNTSALALDATLTNRTQKAVPTDGTRDATIKAASTAAAAADTSLVMALSPNSPVPTGSNTIGKVDQGAPATNANAWPIKQGIAAEVTGSAAALNADCIPATDVSNYSWVSLQIAGTFVAGVTPQISNDNFTNVFGINLPTPDGQAPWVTAVGTPNIVVGPLGAKWFRARATSYTSGTVSCIAEFYTGPQEMQGKPVDMRRIVGNLVSVNAGVPDSGTQRVIQALRRTYSAGSVRTATTSGSGPFFTICGSSTQTIRVKQFMVSGTMATNAAYGDIILRKTSTATSGGTATALAKAPHDSNSAAATATVNYYTTLATPGTAVGQVGAQSAVFPITLTVAVEMALLQFLWQGEQTEAVTLRGTAQCMEAAFNSSPAVPTLQVHVTWTEE